MQNTGYEFAPLALLFRKKNSFPFRKLAHFVVPLAAPFVTTRKFNDSVFE